MKLRTALATLFLLPALIAGCSDDPSGPVDEIYTMQSVQIGGQARAVPAEIFTDNVNYGGGVGTLNSRYSVRAGTLVLRVDGRYSFGADYRLVTTDNPANPTIDFRQGAFEDGTYTRSATGITFSPAPGAQRYLSGTGTLQNEVLTVTILEPLFEEFSNVYTFGR